MNQKSRSSKTLFTEDAQNDNHAFNLQKRCQVMQLYTSRNTSFKKNITNLYLLNIKDSNINQDQNILVSQQQKQQNKSAQQQSFQSQTKILTYRELTPQLSPQKEILFHKNYKTNDQQQTTGSKIKSISILQNITSPIQKDPLPKQYQLYAGPSKTLSNSSNNLLSTSRQKIPQSQKLPQNQVQGFFNNANLSSTFFKKREQVNSENSNSIYFNDNVQDQSNQNQHSNLYHFQTFHKDNFASKNQSSKDGMSTQGDERPETTSSSIYQSKYKVKDMKKNNDKSKEKDQKYSFIDRKHSLLNINQRTKTKNITSSLEKSPLKSCYQSQQSIHDKSKREGDSYLPLKKEIYPELKNQKSLMGTSQNRRNSESERANQFQAKEQNYFMNTKGNNTPQQKEFFSQTLQDDQFGQQDHFNIFGKIEDFSLPLQLKLKQSLERLKSAEDVLKFAESESRNINHKISSMNVEKNQEMYRNEYKNNAENAIQGISKIVNLFEEGMQCIGDRNMLDNVFLKMNGEIQTCKNNVIVILILKAHAKITKLNKNYIKSIELYKQCKNVADLPQLFKYRVSCYKNIGFSFSQLKMYDLALRYYGKMLRVAWYINDKDLELQAYDFIGLQYYYQGKLDRAQYYHDKMIKAQFEEKNSDLLRLGISKIENQLKIRYGNSKLKNNDRKQKQQYCEEMDSSQNFYVSSDSEDDFELPFPTQSNKAQDQMIADSQNPNQEQDLEFLDEQEQTSRENNIGKLKGKKREQIFYHKDSYSIKQANERANKNIRMASIDKNQQQFTMLPMRIINASTFKSIKGSTKIPYRLNHLSMNRDLDNYQSIDARIIKIKNLNFNQQMYDQIVGHSKSMIKNIFEELRDNLFFALAHLEMTLIKQKNPANKRRISLCLISIQQ